MWGVVSAQVAALERAELSKEIEEEVVTPLLKARAGFRKLQARRDRLEENGVRTDSWPCNVAPTLVEHINLYLDWISKNDWISKIIQKFRLQESSDPGEYSKC